MDKHQPEHNNVYNLVNDIFSPISIIFSLLILIAIYTLKVKEVKFSNRVSLRLIRYISITEIIFSISQLLRNQSNLSVRFVSSWAYVFSTLLICFLITAISMNVQIVLLYNYKGLNLTYLKKYYIIIPFSLAMTLSILPMPFGGFDVDPRRKYFWHTTAAWEWLTYSGWISLITLYCVVSISFIYFFLSSKTIKSAESNESNQPENLSSYVARITFYSIMPILAYTPAIISNNNNNSVLNITSLIFISSQSIFIFVIFLFDPIIDEYMLERKCNTKHKQQVLENIQKGVYVNNIYKIDLELPSKTKSNYRSTIYNYAKNRISGITSVLSKKKSVDVSAEAKKKDIFNLDSDEDILCLL